jgi:hypothetical protein
MIKTLLFALTLLAAMPAHAVSVSCAFDEFGSVGGLTSCVGPTEGVVYEGDVSAAFGGVWELTELFEFAPDDDFKIGDIDVAGSDGLAIFIKAGNQSVGGIISPETELVAYDLGKGISHYRTFTEVSSVPIPRLGLAFMLMLASMFVIVYRPRMFS